jgi:menaquinone-dependent protoporphyrinogen oxidase
MTMPILVTYATKHGATQEIAQAIADLLRRADLPVDVKQVDTVEDVSRYSAVVLGSAIYVGQWRKEAGSFLEAHSAALSERPVWIFSSGPTGEGDPVELVKGVLFPEKLEPVIKSIQPRDIAVFHGELDPKELGWGEKLLIKGVKAPVGDFRDWDSVASWATSIAGALRSETA